MPQACRDALTQVDRGRAAHAGLLLAKYPRQPHNEDTEVEHLHDAAIRASGRARDLYALAYRRWGNHSGAQVNRSLHVQGRMVIGLGGDNVLETGITLHHTYGVPLIPGAALKGLAAHYCDEVWGQAEKEFRRELVEVVDGKACTRSGTYHRVLFGTTDDSGHIIFHDAWIAPASLSPGQDTGLIRDVMTPHHPDYYVATSPAPPSDFDTPDIIPFLCVAGTFQVSLSCDLEGEQRTNWANLSMELLCEALQSWGIGGKTSSGYGRLSGQPTTTVTIAAPPASSARRTEGTHQRSRGGKDFRGKAQALGQPEPSVSPEGQGIRFGVEIGQPGRPTERAKPTKPVTPKVVIRDERRQEIVRLLSMPVGGQALVRTSDRDPKEVLCTGIPDDNYIRVSVGKKLRVTVTYRNNEPISAKFELWK